MATEQKAAVLPPRVDPEHVKAHPHDFDRERFTRTLSVRCDQQGSEAGSVCVGGGEGRELGRE